MLPRSHRVSKKLFDEVFKASSPLHSPHFFLRAGRGADAWCRCAVVVSKKVDTRAVRRNALRRKSYDALAHLAPRVKSGSIILLFTKKGSEALSPEEIREEFAALLTRAQLLSPS